MDKDYKCLPSEEHTKERGGKNKYEKLNGSQNEVWEHIAYRTSGGLIKEDLLENHNGNIISKNKHIDLISNNHLCAITHQMTQFSIYNIINIHYVIIVGSRKEVYQRD